MARCGLALIPVRQRRSQPTSVSVALTLQPAASVWTPSIASFPMIFRLCASRAISGLRLVDRAPTLKDMLIAEAGGAGAGAPKLLRGLAL